MEQTPKETARFKIEATGSEWSYKKFAVYERMHRVWWRVHFDITVDGCRHYVREALKLPVYYG